MKHTSRWLIVFLSFAQVHVKLVARSTKRTITSCSRCSAPPAPRFQRALQLSLDWKASLCTRPIQRLPCARLPPGAPGTQPCRAAWNWQGNLYLLQQLHAFPNALTRFSSGTSLNSHLQDDSGHVKQNPKVISEVINHRCVFSRTLTTAQ